MHEVLALAALHIYTQDPENNQNLQLMSTALQSKALTGFDDAVRRNSPEDCLAMLFFAHLLGAHSFYGIFSAREDGLGSLITQLISSMHLLRGVQAIIFPSRNLILDTEIGVLMRDADSRRRTPQLSVPETTKLHEMIGQADISESNRATYKDAVRRLERDFAESDQSDEPLASTNTVFSWLVTTTTEYIDLLDERRPEALVILAYYAVILHRRRSSWIVGQAGRYIFDSILSFLGPRWDEWLEWPSAKFGRDNSTAVTPNASWA